MRARLFEGNLLHASMMSAMPYFLLSGTRAPALNVGRRVQRDGKVRHERLVAPGVRARAAALPWKA